MAKQQSLAAQTQTIGSELKLPDVFSAPAEPIKARFVAPYVTFAHNKRADEWKRIAATLGDPQEGNMYLVKHDSILALAPAKLGWIAHKQFWAEVNPAGEVLKVSWEEKPKPYKEHVEAVVVVYTEQGLIPANIQFRSTKCACTKAMSDALVECQTPDWGNKSEAHKHSLVCNQPWMRFYGIVEVSPPRTSRGSGMTYRLTSAVVKPTSTPEWKQIKEFAESAECSKAFQDAAERFQFRLAELTKKAS